MVEEPVYVPGMVFNQLPKLVRDEFDRVLRSKPYMIPESMLSLRVHDDFCSFSRALCSWQFNLQQHMATRSHDVDARFFACKSSRGGGRRK